MMNEINDWTSDSYSEAQEDGLEAQREDEQTAMSETKQRESAIDPEWFTSVYGCLEAYDGKEITAEQALTRIAELLRLSPKTVIRLAALGADAE